MDILLIFTAFIPNSFFPTFEFLLLFYQNISIISSLLPTLEVFGILGLFWINIVLISTLAPLLVAIIWVPQIYDCVFSLGIYHKLFENQSNGYKICKSGEPFSVKIRKVIGANIVIIFTLFLVLEYIYNSFHSSSVTPFCVNQSAVNSSTISNNLPDPIFIPILLSIPTLLLTLRLLANPTCNWIPDSPKRPGRLSFLNYQIYSTTSKPDSLTIQKIRHFKDQVCSLYFSFIIGTLVLLYFSIIYSVYSVPNYNVMMLFEMFLPKMDLYSIIFFTIMEVVIISLTTLLGEWYLKKYEPIDQI